MPESEVVRLLRQIDLEYEAAKRGLTGFAQTAKHAFITARYNNVGVIQEELARHVGQERANQMVCERYVQIFDGDTTMKEDRAIFEAEVQ